MSKRISNEQFIECFKRLRSPQLVAQELGLGIRSVYSRRETLQNRLDLDLRTVTIKKPSLVLPENQLRAELTLSDCSIVVFSDAHYWPGLVSTAHMALIEVIQSLTNVGAIVANGDVFDGATTGRHARIGWATTPTTKQELEAVQDRLGEIEAVAPKGAKLIRTWGNHDIRFDSRLSNAAPEYEGILGMALSDHLPMWRPAWSLMVNDNVMIKHRYHNGIHATYNNTLKAGRSIVTGHLHRLCITPWGDYNGRRWGVDTGTLADPNGPQFAYAEDNPKPHCSGFAVLSFDDQGEMLPPELCEVVNGRAYFRGRRVDL